MGVTEVLEGGVKGTFLSLVKKEDLEQEGTVRGEEGEG